VPVDDVKLMLNNGLNTLYIKDLVTDLTETFTFFLDVVDPRLIIDSVNVSDITLPFPSQNIAIEGRISDLSDVKALDVTCVNPNGTQSSASAVITGASPEQRFTLQFPCVYPDRKDPDYQPNSAGNPGDTYDSDIHWITTNPDYTFVITDIMDQQFTVNLVAPESRYLSASNVQINETLFDNLEPYLRAASGFVLNKAKGSQLLGVACLEEQYVEIHLATRLSPGPVLVIQLPFGLFMTTLSMGVSRFLQIFMIWPHRLTYTVFSLLVRQFAPLMCFRES
jgi:hypothetical protein